MADVDPFGLDRFVSAQETVFAAALAELRTGRKRGHWMWFVFPQLRGLGRSAAAELYGIGSLEEARAYLAHPVLGPRLRLCTEAMLAVEAGSLHAILGSPDNLKFRSSMTLFSRANGGDGGLFRRTLDRYCSSRPDERTLALLGEGAGRARDAP